MKVLLPVPIAPSASHRDREVDRRRERPPVLGVIDDGFGAVLLPAALAALRNRLRIDDVVYHRKPNLSAATEDAVLVDLDERCRAVIVGVCA
jgi:hypothetical protein